MKPITCIPFQNGLAHYSLIKGYGIYFAELKRFDGPLQEAPPPTVVLSKNSICWTGSALHPTLVAQLGQAIEEAFQDASPS
jgi:hypothetical protein